MNGNVEYYPLTHPQKGIWYTEKLYPGTSIGNIAGTVKIKGNLDYSLLEKAVNLVIEKNESLRLRIVGMDNEPKQYVSMYSYSKLDFFDFSSDELEKLYEWDTLQTQTPFLKSNSNLFYFALVKFDDNAGGVYIKIHHLIGDGWNMVLMTSEIMRYYSILKDGADINENCKPSYIEYVFNEENYKNSNKFKNDREYWKAKFEIVPELAALKVYNSSGHNIKAKRKTFKIPARLSLKIREYCKENRVSIYTLFLAALSIYVNRITSKDDLIFGTPVLNRSNAREKDSMGMFISTAPIWVKVNDNMEFVSFINEISKEWMSVLRHQKYPYDLLLRDLRQENKVKEKLYDIAISYQNAKLHKSNSNDEYETRWHFNGCQTGSLIIHINDREDDGNIILDYDFLSDLYYSKEIEFLNDHMLRLLWHALDNPSKAICKIEMLSEREKHKILYEFNISNMDFPDDKTIHGLFEEQVERTPNNIAIVYENISMTFRELNERSNSWAWLLKELGTKPDSIIGIITKRSFEMIIAVLAVLKAGGAYLPIDPEYPDDRIEYMLNDSKIDILIIQQGLELYNVIFTGRVVKISDEFANPAIKSNIHNLINPSNLAYIIYTSGSTGKPKGVMIEHKSLVNQITGLINRFNLDAYYNHILLAKFTFDVSVQHIFIPLISGGKLFIPAETLINDPSFFWAYLASNKISILNTVPALLNLLLDNISSCNGFSLEFIMVGGDIFSRRLYSKIRSIFSDTKIFNIYGPTETTINATIYECGDFKTETSMLIGKPLYNYKMYILDKWKNPVPINVPGELYISGEGLAKGYLNSPELTSEKFIDNPFVLNEKLYKTGDVARWYPNGDIHFLGRIDSQVKIRGFRIELPEIENCLLGHNSIKIAVVTVKEFYDKKYLCAYIVMRESLSISDVREHLLKYLPYYMVPSFFIELKEIPLSKNGKVDLKMLPEPDDSLIIKTPYAMPENVIEERLIHILSEILTCDNIGINDNIFEIGGDSLSIITFVTKVQKNFSIDIPLDVVYNMPYISRIAKYIEDNNTCISYLEKDKNLILISKGENTNNNFFFIHAGSGEVNVYQLLCENLNKRFNFWGIRADFHMGVAPHNITIKSIAEKYIKKIKSIQSKGPYFIAGWCIGGTIAFEIAYQLKVLNEKIGFLGMFNTIAPQVWKKTYSFTIDTERAFIRKHIPYNEVKGRLYEFSNMNDLWKYIYAFCEKIELNNKIINLLAESLSYTILNAIPNYLTLNLGDLLSKINIIRTLHIARAFYFPEARIDVCTNFFKTLDDDIVNNENNWRLYSKFVRFYEVPGDHFSIFKNPDVIIFSEMMNNAIKLSETQSNELGGILHD